jgi:hypothetical protein
VKLDCRAKHKQEKFRWTMHRMRHTGRHKYPGSDAEVSGALSIRDFILELN